MFSFCFLALLRENAGRSLASLCERLIIIILKLTLVLHMLDRKSVYYSFQHAVRFKYSSCSVNSFCVCDTCITRRLPSHDFNRSHCHLITLPKINCLHRAWQMYRYKWCACCRTIARDRSWWSSGTQTRHSECQTDILMVQLTPESDTIHAVIKWIAVLL